MDSVNGIFIANQAFCADVIQAFLSGFATTLIQVFLGLVLSIIFSNTFFTESKDARCAYIFLYLLLTVLKEETINHGQ